MEWFTLVLFFSVLNSIPNLVVCDRCCQINNRQLPEYKFIRSNTRSNVETISRKTVRNVNECRQFALSKKALAFNYGLRGDRYESNISDRERGGNSVRRLCQVLQCPEIYNSTTLVREKNYRYYSMYPVHIPPGMGSLACIPRAGIFMLSSNNLNYSQARTFCQKINASLAHIISEERTNGLAKYVSQGRPSYVGLSNRDDERIWKNEFDEPLSCFDYQAWGEGEPSHSKGCVGLVRSSDSDSVSFWKVLPCSTALPFVCEIPPAYRSAHDRN